MTKRLKKDLYKHLNPSSTTLRKKKVGDRSGVVNREPSKTSRTASEDDAVLSGITLPKLADIWGSMQEQMRVVEGVANQDFQVVSHEIATLSLIVRSWWATVAAVSLNQFIQSKPQTTYAEKQELARWINASLAPIELSLKSPNPEVTAPCHLAADKGRNPDVGRWFWNYRDEAGTLKHAHTLSGPLPLLELVPSAPRATPSSKSLRLAAVP
jgi:hypothetical protein